MPDLPHPRLAIMLAEQRRLALLADAQRERLERLAREGVKRQSRQNLPLLSPWSGPIEARPERRSPRGVLSSRGEAPPWNSGPPEARPSRVRGLGLECDECRPCGKEVATDSFL